MGSIGGTVLAGFILGVAESSCDLRGPSWSPAVAFGILLLTLAVRTLGHPPMGERSRAGRVSLDLVVVMTGRPAWFAKAVEERVLLFAGYVILQAMIMAVASNILGGFTGYVNFGNAGFFAIGACTHLG